VSSKNQEFATTYSQPFTALVEFGIVLAQIARPDAFRHGIARWLASWVHRRVLDRLAVHGASF
jgi:hypothetical protein